jgi:hypothetical protein
MAHAWSDRVKGPAALVLNFVVVAFLKSEPLTWLILTET